MAWRGVDPPRYRPGIEGPPRGVGQSATPAPSGPLPGGMKFNVGCQDKTPTSNPPPLIHRYTGTRPRLTFPGRGYCVLGDR